MTTVVIPAGAGAGGVVLDAAAGTVTLQGISSARQLTQAGGVLVSNQLALNTQAGVALSNGANRISALNASNTGSGDIVLANGVPLNVLGLSNDSGNIQLVNTGAITTTGPVAAPKGNVSITANSPLSIGLPGVNAGGSISLVASNLTSAGNLTLDGPVRAGDRVILNAGNNLYQNSAVFGVNGVSATAGGGVFYGPLATANNAPISYAANGASVAAPPTEIGAGQAVVSDVINFGDKFSADIQQLPATASDFNRDGTRKHKAGDGVVSEGEVCR